MAHTSEKRWNGIRSPSGDYREGLNQEIGQASETMLKALLAGEELFQQLTEMWIFAGGTDQAVADQLFKEVWPARYTVDPVSGEQTYETQANAQEVAMVADAKEAVTAMHQLYEAFTGGTVAAINRADKLRRMT